YSTDERWSGGQQRWDQPPPPEPSSHWVDERQRAAPPLPSHQQMPSPPPSRPAPRKPHPAQQADEPVIEFAPPPAMTSARSDAATGPGIVSRVWTVARSKAGPALVNSALWLARNLRRREIRKRYNRALVFGHTQIADRKLERLFFIPTRKSETIGPAPERGIHYDGPVPAAAFNWVMSMMPSDLRQFAFVDIRAGRGRTSLLAAKWNLNRIIAYEYDPQTFDDLQMNIAQYPRSRMTCRTIDCCRGDVDGIQVPDQPCIIYFSSAWRERMIPGVMNYVRDTYRQSPRRIYVVLENVDEQTTLGGDTIFEQVEPRMAERMKLKLLSPMDFRVYRSLI
ncbi:MAG: hypothetical protein WBP94_16590, partial [Rhodomicrobiaceae bacterium]